MRRLEGFEESSSSEIDKPEKPIQSEREEESDCAPLTDICAVTACSLVLVVQPVRHPSLSPQQPLLMDGFNIRYCRMVVSIAGPDKRKQSRVDNNVEDVWFNNKHTICGGIVA